MITLGWQEWLSLPDLKIGRIKAKVDTGACCSSMHAFVIDPYWKGGSRWIMFAAYSEPRRIVECHTPVKDRRIVSDSSGKRQRRYVIETTIKIGSTSFMAEMNLTNRDSMRFRMLLGRSAMNGRFIVNPNAANLMR